MKETFIEYKFQLRPKQPATDILIAELDSLGFESFMETSEGLLAYAGGRVPHPLRYLCRCGRASGSG